MAMLVKKTLPPPNQEGDAPPEPSFQQTLAPVVAPPKPPVAPVAAPAPTPAPTPQPPTNEAEARAQGQQPPAPAVQPPAPPPPAFHPPSVQPPVAPPPPVVQPPITISQPDGSSTAVPPPVKALVPDATLMQPPQIIAPAEPAVDARAAIRAQKDAEAAKLAEEKASAAPPPPPPVPAASDPVPAWLKNIIAQTNPTATGQAVGAPPPVVPTPTPYGTYAEQAQQKAQSGDIQAPAAAAAIAQNPTFQEALKPVVEPPAPPPNVQPPVEPPPPPDVAPPPPSVQPPVEPPPPVAEPAVPPPSVQPPASFQDTLGPVVQPPVSDTGTPAVPPPSIQPPAPQNALAEKVGIPGFQPRAGIESYVPKGKIETMPNGAVYDRQANGTSIYLGTAPGADNVGTEAQKQAALVTPITGNETPSTINPTQSAALSGLMSKAQTEAARQLDQPTVYDDALFQQGVDQAKLTLDEQYRQGKNALESNLAQRGLDYSSTAGAGYSGLEGDRDRAFQNILLPLLQERAAATGAGRTAAMTNALNVAGMTSGQEADTRTEMRGERGYVDDLSRQARDQALQEYGLAESAQTANDKSFQDTLNAGLDYGAAPGAASALGTAAGQQGDVGYANQRQANAEGAGIEDLAASAAQLFGTGTSKTSATKKLEAAGTSDPTQNIDWAALYRQLGLG